MYKELPCKNPGSGSFTVTFFSFQKTGFVLLKNLFQKIEKEKLLVLRFSRSHDKVQTVINTRGSDKTKNAYNTWFGDLYTIRGNEGRTQCLLRSLLLVSKHL